MKQLKSKFTYDYPKSMQQDTIVLCNNWHYVHNCEGRNFFNYIFIVRAYLLGYGDPQCCDSFAVSFLELLAGKIMMRRGEIMNEEFTISRRDFSFLLIPFFAEACLIIPVVLSFSITVPSNIITGTAFTIPITKIVLQYGECQQYAFCCHLLNFIEHFLRWQSSIL